MATKKKAAAPRAKKAAVDPNETKAQKFVRLGEARVGKAIKTIGLIGNLSGNGYEYSQAQIDSISKLLKAAVDDTLGKFVPKSAKKEIAVDLGSLAPAPVDNSAGK